MPYKEEFVQFWEHVKDSYQAGTFAKLTMAKTIGKPNLKNIFVRPMSIDAGSKVLVKLRYQSRDTEDEESELTIDEAFEFLKPYLKTSFSSVILFTTTKDLTFKINKKGAVRIIENTPTFQNVIPAKSDLED